MAKLILTTPTGHNKQGVAGYRLEMTQSQVCPQCSTGLPLPLSSGRIVCSNCGWSNQPKKKAAISTTVIKKLSEASESSKDQLNNLLDSSSIHPSKRGKRDFWYGGGALLFVLGLIFLVSGLFYDTTVSSGSGFLSERSHNLGLMNERQIVTNTGGFLMVGGAIFMTRRKK